MSTFNVQVIRVAAIEPIEGADAIELAVVGDYRSVVRKGQYAPGQLAVYIPEQAVLPIDLIKEMGLEGKLAGSNHDRIRAVKLRGCLSQGILYPVEYDERSVSHTMKCLDGAYTFVKEGDDVSADLGIVKWNPPIPTHLSGEVYNAGTHLTVAYDIENFKKYPTVLEEGEEVVITEKLHGSFCGVGILPRSECGGEHFQGEFVVFSKGLGADGLCFKNVPNNEDNAYIRALQATGTFDKLRSLRDAMEGEDGFDKPLFLLGEVYGPGIQADFSYGDKQTFRMFDVVAGFRGDQHYFSYDGKMLVANLIGVDTVPVLYVGPFSKEVMYGFTDGMETVSGKEMHMREGVVVTPKYERYDASIGRVILKSVSAAYLTRKNKNATEYQ